MGFKEQFQPAWPASGRLLWVLVLCLLLAFGLRLFRLDFPDLSGDEAWSVTVASWPLAQVVSSQSETNPPLYHILLHFSMRLFGQSTFAIRYVSVLTGLLALAYVWRLGSRVGGVALGYVTCGIAALSPFLVYYAQDARMYGPALLGAAGSLTIFVFLFQFTRTRAKPPVSLWIWYVFWSLVGAYSHYYMFAVLAAQALAVLTWMSLRGQRARIRDWILSWLVLAILILPWLVIHFQFLGGKASSRFGEWTLASLTRIGRRTLVAYGAGVTLQPTDEWRGWVIIVLALFGFGYLVYRASRPSALLMAHVVFTGILFAWLVNPIMPFFWERYLIVGMPAFLVLLASGIVGLARWRPAAGVAGAIGILVLSVPSLGNHYFGPEYVKGSYGRLMGYISDNAKAKDVVLLNNPLQASLYQIYGPEGMTAYQLPREALLTDRGASDLLTDLTSGHDRVWLVEFGNPAEYDPDHRVLRWLGQQGSRGDYRNFPSGGLLYLFVLDSASEQESLTIEANLNDQIRLTGYSLNTTVARPGDTLLITLQWQSIRPVERAYTVFTHLIGPDGQIMAQNDGQPVGGTYPTDQWSAGESVDDNHALFLPDNLAPGSYILSTGMYLWPELTRLPVKSATVPVVDHSVQLGIILVADSGEG